MIGPITIEAKVHFAVDEDELITPAAAHTAEDWFNGPECAAILAQPVEPCTENPFAGDCEPLEPDA